MSSAKKVVVITGGTSGIGLALATEYARLGAETVLLADKADSVSQAVAQLRQGGAAVSGYVCDVGMPQSVTEICAIVLAKHGPPDVLINSAGFAIYRTFEQEESSEIERLMSVNFAGAIRVTKAFLNAMIQSRRGHIVNVASIAGVMALTPCGVYSAAKHGMVAWSNCLGLELRRFGIHVTAICPGRVETNFFNHESFRTRRHRKETEMTIPMETVVEATFDAVRRLQRVRYVPRRYGLVAWAYHALGPLVRAPLDKLLRARVEDIYRPTGSQ